MKQELSDGEWVLMGKLWDDSPMTITQLTAALRQETGWTKHTVITMLNRLEAKGAVAHEEGPRAKSFFPVLRRADAAGNETKHFLDKVYGGSMGLMMSAMMEVGAISDEDLRELAAILERAKGGDKG